MSQCSRKLVSITQVGDGSAVRHHSEISIPDPDRFKRFSLLVFLTAKVRSNHYPSRIWSRCVVSIFCSCFVIGMVPLVYFTTPSSSLHICHIFCARTECDFEMITSPLYFLETVVLLVNKLSIRLCAAVWQKYQNVNSSFLRFTKHHMHISAIVNDYNLADNPSECNFCTNDADGPIIIFLFFRPKKIPTSHIEKMICSLKIILRDLSQMDRKILTDVD